MNDTMQLTSRFREALTFAALLHSSQHRKGTAIPYIAHLMSVAGLVINHGGNEDEAIAALLHDAVEDQNRDGQTEMMIREWFGQRVHEVVEGCTEKGKEEKRSWKERKDGYLSHLESAPSSVKLVAAADKLDNVRAIVADLKTIGPKVWDRFNAGRQDQLWFYRGCIGALREGGPASMVRELESLVEEMEKL